MSYNSHSPAPSTQIRNMSLSEGSKDPTDIVAEAELQWIYTEEELCRTPSIVAGMSLDEERQMRSKGVNFIVQVGILLKLPQTTVSTASVFFNRFLMRYSLVASEGVRPLHHYQIAAVAIFVATKVEEHSRKLKELVIACCRVAQKNPNLLVDEQTKDYWRWRDTILLNEDVLLDLLCFDLTLKSPYKLLYSMIKSYNVVHHRQLRDTAWAFLNDSNMTQICLLFPSQTIAAAALYCAAKRTKVEFPDDEKGRPWWETQHVPGLELRRAYNYMAGTFKDTPLKPGSESIYVGGLTPLHQDERCAKTRLRTEQAPGTPEQPGSAGDSKRDENGLKRSRDGGDDVEANGNGFEKPIASRVPPGIKAESWSAKRQRTEEYESPPKEHDAKNGHDEHMESAEGSEEGEL